MPGCAVYQQRARKAGGGTQSLSRGVRGQEKMDIPGQEERVSQPFLSSFALFGPSPDWVRPTRYRGQTSSVVTESHASLFQKHPRRHTWKQRLPSNLGVPEPSQADT